MPKDGENLNEKETLTGQGQLAKNGTKMAANAVAGPLAGKAVDLASKTKLGKQALNKMGDNALGKNPVLDKTNPFHKTSPLKTNSPSFSSGQNPSPNNIQNNQTQETTQQNKTQTTSTTREEQKTKGFLPSFGFSTFFGSLNPFKKEVETEQSGTLELKKIKKQFTFVTRYLGCIFSFLSIVVIILILLNISSPLFYINQMINKISSTVSSGLSEFVEKVSNIAKCGYMTDEQCAQKQENLFYKELQKVYEDYRNEYHVSIDYTLIASALTWIDDTTEEISEEDFSNWLEENSNADLESLTFHNSYIDFNKSKKYIQELAAAQVKQEVFDCSEISEDGTKIVKGCIRYALDLDKFDYYLTDQEKYQRHIDDLNSTCFEDGTCPNNQFETSLKHAPFLVFLYNIQENETIRSNNILAEIYDKKEFYEYTMNQEFGNFEYARSYAYCSGVTVKGKDGTIEGTYDLEQYVAGVVAHEADWNENEEAYKAQAIAARTYVLNSTSNCSRSIENSQSAQTFSADPPEWAIKAANDTAGLVLIYNNEIFSTQYDSFCYADRDCPDAVLNANGTYSVTYTKLPLGETHVITLDSSYKNRILSGSGHARGMSQLKSYEMAKNGSNYEEILLYFYSNGVQIASMNMMASGKYSASTVAPSTVEELQVRSMTYANMVGIFGNQTKSLSSMYKYNSSNLGECVWYARGRALELIYFSDMDPFTKLMAYSAIESASGNGEAYYRNTTVFEKTTDYTKPKPGAIVSWSGGSNRCGGGCGHVAIIESVDYAAKTAVVSDGWASPNASGSRPHTWPYVNVRTRTLTFEQIKNYSQGYSFNGYVYILG